MERAFAIAGSHDLQAAWDYLQAIADTTPDSPATRAAIIAEATATQRNIAEYIRDAEDDAFVVAAEGHGGTPVWWVPSQELNPIAELSECDATVWHGGYTWPRADDTNPTEPDAAAIVQCGEDWSHRREDMTGADDAAYVATVDVLNHPGGWPGLVPTHWQPSLWLDAYRTAYAAEWESRTANA